MRLRPLLSALALVGALAATATGQDDDRSPLERLVEEVDVLAERFNRCSALDRGEVGLALWGWRLEARDPPELSQAAWAEAVPRWGGPVRPLLDALRDAPAPPQIDAPLAIEALVALLDAPAGEDAAGRVVRTVTFARGLDRQAQLDLALLALEARRPAHPWLSEARARRSRSREVLVGIEAVMTALALPVDPRTTPRVTLPDRSVVDDEDDDDDDALARYARRGRGAWVVDGGLFDDRLVLRGGRASASLTPRDVDQEVRDWALGGGRVRYGSDPLGVRGAGSTALRAWWAARRALPWTATRLAEQCAWADEETTNAEVLASVALDLAGAVQIACFRDLGLGRPRGPIAQRLRRAVAALDVPATLGPLDETEWADRPTLRRDALRLAEQLDAQEIALQAAPPVPRWRDWQRLAPAERVPYLLRALPDIDGDPTDLLGFGGGGPWGASQRIPADAPPPDVDERRRLRRGLFFFGGHEGEDRRDPPWSGRSAADGLELCGDAAIPALIEAMSDLSPTRSMRTDDVHVVGIMTVAELADAILARIIDHQGVDFHRPVEPWSFEATMRARQAAAREWWATWAPRGGLFALHLAGLEEAEQKVTGAGADIDLGRYERWHRVSWLHEFGGGRERERLRELLRTAADPSARAEWIDLLASAPHDGYVDMVLAELDGPPVCAMAAAAALLTRGDRRGLPRARALLAAALAEPTPGPDEDMAALRRALWLCHREAETSEAGDLILRAVEARSGFDEDLVQRQVELTPGGLLALGRVAARPWELPPLPTRGPRPVSRAALQQLDRDPSAPLQPAGRPRVVAEALAEALRSRRDELALRHAAVTAALAGALDELAAAADLDPVPALLAALTSDDVVTRQSATDALDRLPPAWDERMAAVAPPSVRGVLAAARRRARDRVVVVEVDGGVPAAAHEALVAWRGGPLRVERLETLLRSWEATQVPGLELVLERVESEPGLVARLACFGADDQGAARELVVRIDGRAVATTLAPDELSSARLASLITPALTHGEWSRIVVRARR